MAKIRLFCCFAAVFAAVLSALAGESAATDNHPKATRRTNPDPDFDIPPTLIARMQAAHYAVARKELCKVGVFDVCEFAALMKIGLTNAYEIAQRPRGEMKFCDDLFTEEYRKNMWPFDVEAFEKSLETNLVRGGGRTAAIGLRTLPRAGIHPKRRLSAGSTGRLNSGRFGSWMPYSRVWI